MLFYAVVSLQFVLLLVDFKSSIEYCIVLYIYTRFVSFSVAFWFEPLNLQLHYNHNRYQTKFLTATLLFAIVINTWNCYTQYLCVCFVKHLKLIYLAIVTRSYPVTLQKSQKGTCNAELQTIQPESSESVQSKTTKPA